MWSVSALNECLRNLHRRRRVGADLPGPRPRGVEQLAPGHDLVDQAPALGGDRVVPVQQEPDLPGPLLPHHPRQVRRAEARVERPDPGPGLGEGRVLGGDREVAQHVQDVPAADRDPVDGGDHRLRDVADDPVQPLDLEGAPLGLAVPAGLGPLLDVAAGAERPLAGGGEDDGGDPAVGPGVLERRDQLVDGAAAEGVHPVLPVDRDDRVVVLLHLVPDVGELLELHPRAPPRRIGPHEYVGPLTGVNGEWQAPAVLARRCLVTGRGPRHRRRRGAAGCPPQGHRVALTARSADELDALAARAARPVAASCRPTSPTRPPPTRCLAAVEREWGAGRGARAQRRRRRPPRRWRAPPTRTGQRMLELNLTAPFRLLRRALPGMVEQGWGRVVAIASIAAKRGEPYVARVHREQARPARPGPLGRGGARRRPGSRSTRSARRTSTPR